MRIILVEVNILLRFLESVHSCKNINMNENGSSCLHVLKVNSTYIITKKNWPDIHIECVQMCLDYYVCMLGYHRKKMQTVSFWFIFCLFKKMLLIIYWHVRGKKLKGDGSTLWNTVTTTKNKSNKTITANTEHPIVLQWLNTFCRNLVWMMLKWMVKTKWETKGLKSQDTKKWTPPPKPNKMNW